MAGVKPDERLARFILSRSWINWAKLQQPVLRPDAFMPHPRIELSVYRISGLLSAQVRQIAEQVAAERQKPLVGRGEIMAGMLQAVPPLQVVPKEPPPHHADIVGWPKEVKSAQKLLAQKLAEASELVLEQPLGPDGAPTARS